ncbi:YeiH family protein [Anaeromyxobacter paludicola]|uniref:UPF0324 membrane protein n=1 Tax=Anaeromyxobacter paludicola TaxID=2918171 RepID=A0ABM7XBA2_9BACT|nr:putative sulfate exporter family transporter [Anaeromyxobacter paludicola]BDG09140.1 UPF0324 membrane protein [Anaeromyxobacter paludicola]
MTESSARPHPAARRLLPACAAAALLVPQVSSGAALLGGAALALTLGNPWPASTRRAVKRLLPLAVVGLGGGMDLRAVLATGARGFGYTLVSIAACLAVGRLLARALRVENNTGLLITVGTAICGGSAIAAAAPVVRAEEHETSVALATVFVLNGLALLIFPAIGHRAGLEQGQFGVWAALAIHDTSSVVGASLQYGQRALQVATSIKLARALWIVPVTLALGVAVGRRRQDGAAAAPGARPWFILGFVVLAALVTFAPALRPAGHLASEAAKRVMVLVLFLIGAGLSRDALRALGLRPVAHGVLLWVAVGVASLGAIQAGLLSP